MIAPTTRRNLKQITVEIPERHAELLDQLASETDTEAGQIVAQAIAMLHAVHTGVWRIENNQMESAANG